MSATGLLRILDASLNRASEGLRVSEDFVRFELDDPHLSALAKSLRHDLAATSRRLPLTDRMASRDTLQDVGTLVTTDTELVRADSSDVCLASFKRVQQALRSLEEYSKMLDGELAREFETLRYRLYTLEKAVHLAVEGAQQLDAVQLMVLVEGGESPGQFRRLISELVQAKVDAIQLRWKAADDRDLVERAASLVELTANEPTLAVINDRADIGALVGANAIHVGQEDLDVHHVRAIVGPGPLIGVSTHNIEQARNAVLAGANYLGAGPTFPSRTKTFSQLAGLEFLRQLADEIALPTFAIGGIDGGNIHRVLETGLTRVAVSSTVTQAANRAQAALDLMDQLKCART